MKRRLVILACVAATVMCASAATASAVTYWYQGANVSSVPGVKVPFTAQAGHDYTSFGTPGNQNTNYPTFGNLLDSNTHYLWSWFSNCNNSVLSWCHLSHESHLASGAYAWQNGQSLYVNAYQDLYSSHVVDGAGFLCYVAHGQGLQAYACAQTWGGVGSGWQMGGRVNCPNESWGEFSGDTSGLFTRVDGTQLTGSVGTFGWRDFQIEVTPNDLVNAVHKCNAGANVDPSQWYVDWIDRGWEAGGFSDSYLEPVDYMPYETVYSSNNSVLDSGQVLGTGQSMYSPNGRYRLTMQTDGNLVLYDTSNNSPLWGTNCCTLGWTHAYATVQPAGNLVIYADGGAAFGVTNPCGWSSGAYLVLTDDGNLALRNSDGTERWSVAHGGCG